MRIKEDKVGSYGDVNDLKRLSQLLKQRFASICSELGVWTAYDTGCEAFGLKLRIGIGREESHEFNNETHSYETKEKEYIKRIEIDSPKYYLSTIGNALYGGNVLEDEFDDFVIEYLEKYSHLFDTDLDERVDGSTIAAQNKLLKDKNPEPWNDFVADEGSFRKAVRQAFKSDRCKYIDTDEQYDVYGEEHFEVGSTKDDDTLSIQFDWCGEDNADDYVTFKFAPDLSYTAELSGRVISGKGYEDAAMQYVTKVANKYAKGEFAKDYIPECYELWVYLRQDFYTKASRNIWDPIESIFENGGTYTGYQPEDYVDDRAAVWTSVEVEDLKKALEFLKKKNPKDVKVFDSNHKDVTSEFWTPKTV